MAAHTILITTPMGNVGYETLKALQRRPERSTIRVVAAVRQFAEANRAMWAKG